MITYSFHEIVTKDKLFHQGVYFEPSHKKNRAFLWIHGLTSTFYSHIHQLDAFSELSSQIGYGFAAFNNRGHDMVAGMRVKDSNSKKGYTYQVCGAGREVFEQSVYDIDAGLDFLISQGYNEVVLIGHSTGANKVCFYAGTVKDERVRSVVLASPCSDRLDPSVDEKKRDWQLSMMEAYLAEGKSDELFIGYHFFPMTPRRFLSLYRPNSTEDTFDYGDKEPKLTCFSRIQKPLHVIFAQHDEYLDRPVDDVLSIFKEKNNSDRFITSIITGADHSFSGFEKKLAEEIALHDVSF